MDTKRRRLTSPSPPSPSSSSLSASSPLSSKSRQQQSSSSLSSLNSDLIDLTSTSRGEPDLTMDGDLFQGEEEKGRYSSSSSNSNSNCNSNSSIFVNSRTTYSDIRSNSGDFLGESMDYTGGECGGGGGPSISSISSASSSSSSTTTTDLQGIVIVTWNIDGLNPLNRYLRTLSVLEKLRAVLPHPDAILLQEVVPSQLLSLQQCLELDYYILTDHMPDPRVIANPYFTVTLIRKARFPSSKYYMNTCRVPFRGDQSRSDQGRDILLTEIYDFANNNTTNTTTTVRDGDRDMDGSSKDRIVIGNLHLESGKECSATRTQQLVQALGACAVSNSSHFAIVAGDLNLRNEEYVSAKKQYLASSVDVQRQFSSSGGDLADVSETFASKSYSVTHHKKPPLLSTYTYPGNPNIKCRFDRIYCNSSRLQGVAKFELIGTEEIGFFRDTLDLGALSLDEQSRLYYTPSDHYGVLSELIIKQ